MKARFPFALFFLLAMNIVPRALPQGTAFTYQGHLTDGTNAARGLYDLRFAIYDAASGGNRVGSPLTNFSVAVNNGQFAVTLDFGRGAFDGNPRWLETGVRSNGAATAFSVLSPRQSVTPTPYAIHAANTKLLDGHGTNAFAPATGSANYVAVTSDGGVLFPGGVWNASGNVGIGSSSPRAKLDVEGDLHLGGRIFGNADRENYYIGSYPVTDSDGLDIHWYGGVRIGTRDGTAFQTLANGNVGIGTTSPVAKLNVDGGNIWIGSGAGGSTRLEFDGTSNITSLKAARNGSIETQIAFWTQRATGEFGERVRITGDGNVGIGTTAPEAKLEVNRGDGEGRIRVTGTGTGYTQADILLQSSTANNPENRGLGIYTFREGRDANWYWGNPYDFGAADKFVINRKAGSSFDDSTASIGNSLLTIMDNGNVGIGTTGPSAKLEVVGSLKVSGTGNSISTPVLTITGGADVAEPFAMSEPDLPQGAVVVINEASTGQLKLSAQPYDTRVAGIISGAGGVNSGLTLRQQGVLDGGQNVALSGRVYALADATESPIKPGDLLTTSSTPGHCMKATDRERRDGAILGKAMSSLNANKGLVLVLVSLQ